MEHVILYLDFDGVLHHDGVYRGRGRQVYLKGDGMLFEHAAALELALQPFPMVRIVLSTTWVAVFGFTYAKERLPLGLQGRVVGATYHRCHTPNWVHQKRYVQILADVARRGLGTRWLAIDDDDDGWPEIQRGQLIRPDPTAGLRPSDLEMLALRLRDIT